MKGLIVVCAMAALILFAAIVDARSYKCKKPNYRDQLISKIEKLNVWKRDGIGFTYTRGYWTCGKMLGADKWGTSRCKAKYVLVLKVKIYRGTLSVNDKDIVLNWKQSKRIEKLYNYLGCLLPSDEDKMLKRILQDMN